MVRSYPLRASVGGVLLAALLLTGCGTEDDDAAASPSSTAPASAPADSSPSSAPGSDATPADYVPASLDGPARNVPEPVMPDLAREESREGAQAFLDYWSDVKWYAYQTGDTSHAREIISPACEVCMGELLEIENLYHARGWAVGGRETIRLHGGELVRAPDGIYKPVVTSKYEGIEVIDAGSVVLREDPKDDPQDTFQVYLDYSGGSWRYITAALLPGAG